MNYKAIIFDMNGTIIDTNNIWKKATCELIESCDIILDAELKKELLHKIQGLAFIESCKIIKDIAKRNDPVAHLIKEKSSLACNHYTQDIKFIAGFEEVYQNVVYH